MNKHTAGVYLFYAGTDAGTLTGTNAYDCVTDNTRRAVAHFSSIAICVPVNTKCINNCCNTMGFSKRHLLR